MGCNQTHNQKIEVTLPQSKSKNSTLKSLQSLDIKNFDIKQREFEEYELLTLQKIAEKDDGAIIINLAVYTASKSYPFYVQKKFSKSQEYYQEKNIYSMIAQKFSPKIQQLGVLMEASNDANQEIFFGYGKCNLLELAQYYQSKGQLFPNELIILTFKVMSELIFLLYNGGQYYYTDCKPENMVLQLIDDKTGYHLKFIDFGSVSNKIVVETGYTLQYFASELCLKRINASSIQFQSKEERLYNEFYTIARTLQRILLDKLESNLELFMSCENAKSIALNNQKMLQTISEHYKQQIENDSLNGKTVERIFSFMKQFTTSQCNNFSEIKSILKEIKINHFYDKENYVQAIVQSKIQQRAEQSNPLEILLSMNYNIDLNCSRYTNQQQADKRLEYSLLEFLKYNRQSIYILFGKSGSGKSLFLKQFYLKLVKGQSSYENQNDNDNDIQSGQYSLPYSYNCFYTRLKIYSSEKDKDVFREEMQKQMSTLGQEQKLILFLDGVDEFGEGKDKILEYIGVRSNPKDLEKVKIIITCCSNSQTGSSEMLSSDIFKISGLELKSELEYICTISEEQMESYMKQLVQILNHYKESAVFGQLESFQHFKEYREILNYNNGAMKKLGTDPLTIRLLVGIMPIIKQQFRKLKQCEQSNAGININQSNNSNKTCQFNTDRPNDSETISHNNNQINQNYNQNANICQSGCYSLKITMLQILQIFTEKWIEIQILRLSKLEKGQLIGTNEKFGCCKEETNIPTIISIITDQVALKLAEYLWINNLVSKNIFDSEDIEHFSQFYGINPQKIQIAIKCLPITIFSDRGQSRFEFTHKSFLEYYLAQLWIKDFALQISENNFQEVEEKQKDQIKKIEQLSLSKKFIVPSEYTSLFLACSHILELENQNGSKQQSLYSYSIEICLQILELSKQPSFKELAASSNAFTILNFLKFSFSEFDLSYIKIRNACGDLGQFENANFQFAQIEDSTFSRANLNGCDFSNATFKNVDFQISKPDFLGHQGQVNTVAITLDKKYLVSGSDDQSIRIWNFDDGSMVKQLQGHSAAVTALSITPNQKYIVSGSADNSIKIWGLQSGEEIRTLQGHNGPITSLAISFTSTFIISGSLDATLKIWDIQTGEEMKTLSGHKEKVRSVAISRDEKLLASGSGSEATNLEYQVKLWNFETGKEVHIFTGHIKPVTSVVFTADQRCIVSGSEDCTIKIWNIQNGSTIRTIMGHRNSVTTLAISPDQKYIVAGGSDSIIKIWNFDNGTELKKITGHTSSIKSVAISSDQQYIISGSKDCTIKVWPLEQLSKVKSSFVGGHCSQVNSLVISNDSKFLISGSNDSQIKIWNLQTGLEVTSINYHEDAVKCVVLTPDQKNLVSCSRDTTIKVWNLESNVETRTMVGHTGSVTSLAVSPDQNFIATGSDDWTVKIWNLKSGSEIRTISGHRNTITAVAITSDQQSLVTSSRDQSIKVWNFANGNLKRTLAGHTHGVYALSLTCDSKSIISASNDLTIKVWNLEDGTVVRNLDQVTSPAQSLALSPDQKYLIGGCQDSKIKIWNIETGQIVKTIIGHSGVVSAIAVTPDQKFIVSGSQDHTIRVWNFDLDNGLSVDVNLDNESLLNKNQCNNDVIPNKNENYNSRELDIDKKDQNQNKIIIEEYQNKQKLDKVTFWKLDEIKNKLALRNKKRNLIRCFQEINCNVLCNGIKLEHTFGLSNIQVTILSQLAKQSLTNLTPTRVEK